VVRLCMLVVVRLVLLFRILDIVHRVVRLELSGIKLNLKLKKEAVQFCIASFFCLL